MNESQAIHNSMINFINIILSRRSQTLKRMHCVIPFTKRSQYYTILYFYYNIVKILYCIFSMDILVKYRRNEGWDSCDSHPFWGGGNREVRLGEGMLGVSGALAIFEHLIWVIVKLWGHRDQEDCDRVGVGDGRFWGAVNLIRVVFRWTFLFNNFFLYITFMHYCLCAKLLPLRSFKKGL